MLSKLLLHKIQIDEEKNRLEELSRIKDEIETHKSLKHKNIVSLVDSHFVN